MTGTENPTSRDNSDAEKELQEQDTKPKMDLGVLVGDLGGEKVMEVLKGTQERIIVNPFEALKKYRTLYENPNYTFLTEEKYQKFREVFPNLSEKDIIGEGMNGIVVKHPDSSKVIKIIKPGGDKLNIEYRNQKGFIRALETLQKKFKGNLEYEYLTKFHIPDIAKMEGTDGVYIMGRVDGHAFKTLALIKQHGESLKDLPDGWYKGMTDNEVEIFLEKRGLKIYPKSSTEMDDRWGDDIDRNFIVDLESEGTKMMRREDVEKIINLLKSNGYDHGDAHWGNAMKVSDDIIYIIDFGRSKIPAESK